MRKRNNQIIVRLSEEEYKPFKKQLEISGLSINDFIINLIMGATIKERPPKDYAKIIYEICKIGNNVNQLAYKANKTNKTNYTAVEDTQTAVLLMEKCYKLVKSM